MSDSRLVAHYRDGFKNIVADTSDPWTEEALDASIEAWKTKHAFAWFICRGDDRKRQGSVIGFLVTQGANRKSVRHHSMKKLDRFDQTTGQYGNKVDLKVRDGDWLMCLPLAGSDRKLPEEPETATGVSGFVMVDSEGKDKFLVCSDDKYRHIVSYRNATTTASSTARDVKDDKKSPTEVALPGGAVAHGETIDEGWLREIREEVRVQKSKNALESKNVDDGLEVDPDSVQCIAFTSISSGNRYGCRGEFYTMFGRANFDSSTHSLQADGHELDWVALATGQELCNTTQWTKKPAALRYRMAKLFEVNCRHEDCAQFWASKAADVQREIGAEAAVLRERAASESGTKKRKLEQLADHLNEDRVRTAAKRKLGEPNEMIYICC